MLCMKCKKNMAIVFIKRMEAGKQVTEGYCLACANELGIYPLNDMMKQMGMSEDDMESMQDQFGSMMEMLENGEVPPELQSFAGNLGFTQPDGGINHMPKAYGSDEDAKKKSAEKRKRPRLIDTFGANMNKRAKEGMVDRVIGREKELMRVIQIINRRAKNNPVLIGEPGVGKTAIAESLALRIVEKKVPS